MSFKIYKYTLPIDDDNVTVAMPANARILSVANQGESLCLWAQVNSEEPSTLRRFAIRGTGHEMLGAEASPFVGTVLVVKEIAYGGCCTFVWHVFDMGETE